MTKAERLIYLVNLIKERGSMYVGDMSAECGVSPRTIYRDLSSLLKMNIPIYYKNGYRLLDDASIPSQELGVDDMELICYAVRNNPIAQNPFFKNRFHSIEQKLRAKKTWKREKDHEDIILFDDENTCEPSDQAPIMANFLSALYGHRKVLVSFKESNSETLQYIPIAIKISNSQPHLVLTSDVGFSAAEIPASSVRMLSVSTERFDRRPIELINRRVGRDEITV